jgi:hypothetical protein
VLGVVVEHVSAHHLSQPASQPTPGGRARHPESLSKVEITSATDELSEAVVVGDPIGHRANITHEPALNNLVSLEET